MRVVAMLAWPSHSCTLAMSAWWSRRRPDQGSFYWDSVPHCRNPPSACQVRGRAIPCSDCAKQRHDIIPNRLALAAEESVSGVTGATAQVNQETPPMRIYITVEKLLRRFPLIQAVEWAPLISSAQRGSFEAAQQTDMPGFEMR